MLEHVGSWNSLSSKCVSILLSLLPLGASRSKWVHQSTHHTESRQHSTTPTQSNLSATQNSESRKPGAAVSIFLRRVLPIAAGSRFGPASCTGRLLRLSVPSPCASLCSCSHDNWKVISYVRWLRRPFLFLSTTFLVLRTLLNIWALLAQVASLSSTEDGLVGVLTAGRRRLCSVAFREHLSLVEMKYDQ